MNLGEKYFVRIDKKADERQLDGSTREAHFQYLRQLSAETRMYGGGFGKEPGGMVIFVAKDLYEANLKCVRDPVIAEGYYSYELYEWTIQLMSPGA